MSRKQDGGIWMLKAHKPNMVIRPCTMTDLPSMLPLMAQLGYPTDLTSLERVFVRFMDSSGYGVVISCLNERIIGWIAWSKSLLLVSEAARFRIEGLVVDEEYRGQGIGKKLMLYVEEVAGANGKTIIELTSGLRRSQDRSHEFYKSLGYRNDGSKAKLYLRKEIG